MLAAKPPGGGDLASHVGRHSQPHPAIAVTSLELKIPPPAVAAVLAAAMWGLARVTPSIQMADGVRLASALAVALAAIGFSVAGVLAFRRARTTINPTQPQLTSSLVSSGIYTVTRNPMYVGLLLVLVAWAIVLSSAWALLGPVAYFFY
ncbi:MAG TPA: methyltransferase, partial [Casimicrobiaceae bacterium]|nr:methyltransferase [Casimicrobiaceae bacterium]